MSRSQKRFQVDAGPLPRWLRDEVTRMTPKARREPALAALTDGASAFAAGRYGAARQKLEQAKTLTPRSPTVRELLGLSAYNVGDWKPALAELRTYRRLSGDTTHMPVEMDCLRALNRPADVDKTWEQLVALGGTKATFAEARVVYASHLLDQGDAEAAWRAIRTKRPKPDPTETDLRLWFVAARAAAATGRSEVANDFVTAIRKADQGFPGLDELAEEVARYPSGA